jgi:hypothetical protein
MAGRRPFAEPGTEPTVRVKIPNPNPNLEFALRVPTEVRNRTFPSLDVVDVVGDRRQMHGHVYSVVAGAEPLK